MRTLRVRSTSQLHLGEQVAQPQKVGESTMDAERPRDSGGREFNISSG